MQLLRVIVLDGETVTAIAAVNDRNTFVSVAPPQIESPATAEEDEETTRRKGGLRLLTASTRPASSTTSRGPILDQIIKVASTISICSEGSPAATSFEVFYAEDEENEDHQDLYASRSPWAALTKHYYRFQTGEDGIVDFFDERGQSNRKFLIRKPISEGILRSTFGMRYHPILRYSRMHTGIDWANKVGTPIIAAGDGRIRFAGWESGYGRRIEIEHPYNFVTTYNHMSGFARGIKEASGSARGRSSAISAAGPLDRSAPALRGDDQRELRRSALRQGAPQPRARHPAARGFQTRARPYRRPHQQGSDRDPCRRTRPLIE